MNSRKRKIATTNDTQTEQPNRQVLSPWRWKIATTNFTQTEQANQRVLPPWKWKIASTDITQTEQAINTEGKEPMCSLG